MPLIQNASAPTTIDEAKTQGVAVAGAQFMAPLGPKSGAIDLPAGSFVIGVVKNLWDSPTIKALRNAAATACGLAVGVFVVQVLAVNGDLWAINYQTTEKAAIAAAAFSLASAYAAWWKAHDNDPLKQGAAKP